LSLPPFLPSETPRKKEKRKERGRGGRKKEEKEEEEEERVRPCFPNYRCSNYV